MSDAQLLKVLDILPELWAKGYQVLEQDNEWNLFRSDGEGILFAPTFRELCEKIVTTYE